ncbi:MAG: hypothetical protein ACLT5P_08565 [Flavonifractor plautii]
MNAIWQVLLALLAAVGLLALGWLTFGRLLTPVGGGGGGPVYAVVPASGDGAHLEQDVKGLLWLRGRRAGPLHHRHRRRRAGRYGAGGGRGPAGPRPGDRPLPGGAAGGVHQGMKRVRRPADFFLRAGAGRRISGAAKRTKLRLPVDKSGHR